ncbi:MAG TPA: globin [Candidatus Corynebacterium avicola]|uniref:Globin n=1 Tax=Candidatus Corynebacterium avicola TaxID=2838527 RepID=A0A9D1RRC1_9CORY|nr:globin [Candidatus Corynebacterium avicola]
MSEQPSSLFEAIGGEPMFDRIVSEFYRQVPDDPILGPMYPADDMDGAEDRLRWFLMQYWGGPQTFNEQRGHPRLRMRHMHFHINPAARERWLVLMGNALETIPEEDLPEPARAALWDHMVRVADMLVNRLD